MQANQVLAIRYVDVPTSHCHDYIIRYLCCNIGFSACLLTVRTINIRIVWLFGFILECALF